MVRASVATGTHEADVLPESGRNAREQKLSSVLGEFARTLSTDFPVQGILDHFVKRIVEVLPVTSAGVTLISAGSRAPLCRRVR